jgi:Flp pilus assembly protein TadD
MLAVHHHLIRGSMSKPLGKKHRKPDFRPQILEGLKLEDEGRLEEAQQIYFAVLDADETNAYATNRLAVMCSNRGDNAAALQLIEISLKSNPVSPEAVVDYAQILDRLGRHEDALAAANRALILKPNDFNGLFLRGVALQKLGRHREAAACFERAVALNPADARAHNLRGFSLSKLGRVEEALAGFERAQELDPAYADAHLNEALVRLLMGDFKRGWEKYECRWRSDQVEDIRSLYPQPHWDGETSLAGKSLYVYTEQGLGDAIMFSRYLPLLAGQAERVIFAVHRPLKTLLASLEGVTTVSPGDAVKQFDLQCALLSLPRLLRTDINTIPAAVPYLHAPPERLAKWQGRLPSGTGPKVGLVWAGGSGFVNDKTRSIGLEGFAPILAQSRCRFVSLQRDLRADDHALLVSHPDLIHFGDQLEDFADTAAVISQLDVVVSVDTSVAHLAGALAKPVFILLPFAPDFRWMLARSDSPWYPTATLFRQPQAGDWASVIATVAGRLGAFG